VAVALVSIIEWKKRTKKNLCKPTKECKLTQVLGKKIFYTKKIFN
jgi:hypothetical protein